ncbi:MAG: PDZ domain-containing protein [Gemmataceae bacterium]
MRSTNFATLRPIALATVFSLLAATAKAQVPAQPGLPRGILVTSVVASSTAAQANLHAGDIITRVNDRRVTDLWEFVERLSQSNGAARLSVFDRSTRQFRVADVRPDRQGLIGVYGIPTDRLVNYATSVLVVNGVNAGTPAHLAGLAPGDIVLAVNGVRVSSIPDFIAAFRLSAPLATLSYISTFDGQARTVTVPSHPFGQIGAYVIVVPWR